MAGKIDAAVSRAGWVPSRFRIVKGEALVDWCWLGATPLDRPFFDETIDRAQRLPFNTLFAHRTPMAELIAWAEERPGLAPAGFIFHMSRCGSTLISGMLAAMPENVVLSEAQPLEYVARLRGLREEGYAVWLKVMLSALSQPRRGGETRCFVKFDAATAVALPAVRRAFPQVPWIFVYRDPEEVLVSQLRSPAAAMARGMVTDVRLVEGDFASISAMDQTEYAARAIGRLCGCAAEAVDERGLLVNYSQLPDIVTEGIAAHFKLDLPDEDRRRMAEVALFHAKHPRQRFEADGDGKRSELTEAARAAADRWIRPVYEQLERIRV